MKRALLFANGPTPTDPEDARQLGWFQCWFGREIDRNDEAFSKYIPTYTLPEMVAVVQSRGRDCTYRIYDEAYVLLCVEAAETP